METSRDLTVNSLYNFIPCSPLLHTLECKKTELCIMKSMLFWFLTSLPLLLLSPQKDSSFPLHLFSFLIFAHLSRLNLAITFQKMSSLTSMRLHIPFFVLPQYPLNICILNYIKCLIFTHDMSIFYYTVNFGKDESCLSSG